MKEKKIEPNINHNQNQNQCHCHCNNHNCNNNVNIISYKKESLQEKMIYIPLILIKIFSSFYLYEKYFCHSLKNDLDVNYSQKSFFILIIYLIILYISTIISSPSQTNINKNTSLNINNRELIKFKQNYRLCNFCKGAKFIRTSHCRLCDKCISFRDHHCSFTTTCIGINNMQIFINFCFWGLYAIIFVTCSYFKYETKDPSFFTLLIFKIDFIGNLFFISALNGIIVRCLFYIYNNHTYLESIRQIGVEIKFPIYNFTKEINKKKSNNFYNIGFLNHLYYSIGPSLLHLILPLPKLPNYILIENSPIFCKGKMPDKFQIFKYRLKTDNITVKENLSKDSDPDIFIKNCHINYYNKIII